MPNSKSPKTDLSEASSNKKPTTPASPKVSRLTRVGSNKHDAASPLSLQNSRHSMDRSPRSGDSRPSVERRSPKVATSPEKQAQPLRSLELQTQISSLQADLKKTSEKLASVEEEKTKAVEEAKEAKRLVEEINEKFAETLVAQRRAEESLEIEKFRADELEQGSIEAAQKREEEWQKELDTVKNQHAVDVATLLSATQELQNMKHELAMTTEAKNTALGHADDAMKIAEINVERMELLSREVSQLNMLLDSKQESKSLQDIEAMEKLDAEIQILRRELEEAKGAEEKLLKMKDLVEDLKNEVTYSKGAESDARDLVNDWKKKAELFEAYLAEANESEKSSRESLCLATKKLEESNSSLSRFESEVTALNAKILSLEADAAKHVVDLRESDRCLDAAQQEVVQTRKQVEELNNLVQMAEQTKEKAVHIQKAAASEIDNLLEEKNNLIKELKIARNEGEEAKRAMEDLASALHEVSTEARETKEILLTKQGEVEGAGIQIEKLELTILDTMEKYQVMLDEEKHKFLFLKNTFDKHEMESQYSKAEWDEKELSFASAIKKLEEEKGVITEEISAVKYMLQEAENDSRLAKEAGIRINDNFKQAESKVTAANEAILETRMECLKLKDTLLDKENELQNIIQENEELRLRELAASEKVDKLSALLTEAETTNSEKEAFQKAYADSLLLKESLLDKENALQSIIQENNNLRMRETDAMEKVKDLSAKLSDATTKKFEENNMLSCSELQYDLLPNHVVASEDENDGKGHNPESDEGLKNEGLSPKNAILMNKGNEFSKVEDAASIETNDLLVDRDTEGGFLDNESDSKVHASILDQTNRLSSENTNNGTSPRKQHQKKKKAFLQKFGSLIKKRSNN